MTIFAAFVFALAAAASVWAIFSSLHQYAGSVAALRASLDLCQREVLVIPPPHASTSGYGTRPDTTEIMSAPGARHNHRHQQRQGYPVRIPVAAAA